MSCPIISCPGTLDSSDCECTGDYKNSICYGYTKYIFVQVPANEKVTFNYCGEKTQNGDAEATYYFGPDGGVPGTNQLEAVTEDTCNSGGNLDDICTLNSYGYCYTEGTYTYNDVSYSQGISDWGPDYVTPTTCSYSNTGNTVSPPVTFSVVPYVRNICIKLTTPSNNCGAEYDLTVALTSPTPNPTPKPTPKPTPSPTYPTYVSTPYPTYTYSTAYPTLSPTTGCNVQLDSGTFCEGTSYEISYNCYDLTGCPSAYCTSGSQLYQSIYYNGVQTCYYNMYCCTNYNTPYPTPSPTPFRTPSPTTRPGSLDGSGSAENTIGIIVGVVLGLAFLFSCVLACIIMNNKKKKQQATNTPQLEMYEQTNPVTVAQTSPVV